MSKYEVSKGKFLLSIILGVVLVGINAYLLIQNRRLSSSIDDVLEASHLNSGAIVSTLRGVDIEGHNVIIDYVEGDRKTVLFIFTPDCGYCEQIMPFWQGISEKIDRRAFRVFAVSLKSDGTKEFVSRYRLTSSPVLEKVYFEGSNSYKFSQTPETVLIDADGKVEKVWKGPPDEKAKKEIEVALARS